MSTSPASPIAGIDQRRADGMNLDRLVAEQEARHVEIVDHHVAEEAARALRHTPPAAAPGSREMTVTSSTLPASPAATPTLARGEIGIEAAVKADHQRRAGGLHDGQAGADAIRAEIDRLFAEHGLAGLRCAPR